MKIKLRPLLEEVEKENKIKIEVIVDALRSALLSAYRKHFGRDVNVSVNIDPDTDELKVLAKKKGESKEVEIETPPSDLSRIAFYTAKQVITQKIQEAKKDKAYQELKKWEGKIFPGVIRHKGYKVITVAMEGTEAILPRNEQVPGEDYRPGNKMWFYVLKTEKTPRESKLLLSRAHPELIKKLFAREIPEIAQGLIEIKSIARELGNPSGIQVVSLPTATPPAVSDVPVLGESYISSIDQAKVDQKMTLKGVVVDIDIFKDGRGRTVKISDGTGGINVLILNNLYYQMPQRDSLSLGATIQVRGWIRTYKGNLEIWPKGKESSKTKVAVWPKVEGVDSVKACTGEGRQRINSILQELRGEEIDIVPYSEDVATFIANALRPTLAREVVVYRKEGKVKVIVAVPRGKPFRFVGEKGRGRNIRLAERLTGWRIDLEYLEDVSKKITKKMIERRKRRIAKRIMEKQ